MRPHVGPSKRLARHNSHPRIGFLPGRRRNRDVGPILACLLSVMKAPPTSTEIGSPALRSRGEMGTLVILASVAALLAFLRACI